MKRLTALLLAVACDEGTAPQTAADAQVSVPASATVSEVRAVVPGSTFPSEVVIQNANNNLDLVEHEGRLFLAFRTAPTHFASVKAMLYVVSTLDEQTWRLEGQFAEHRDVREPRLLSLNGALVLLYAVLGEEPTAFEPQGMKRAVWLGEGGFGPAAEFMEPGFIPWRAKAVDGVGYLMAYSGGANIYTLNGDPIEVHFFRTLDGEHFEPFDREHPVVLSGGTSETDFVFLDDGALVAVARNEAGEEGLGFGSKICRGEAGAEAVWRCVVDPRKFDSPLVFREGKNVYLLARRNLSETGNYDLNYDRRPLADGGDGRPLADQAASNQIGYWTKPKRCALWQIDPDALTVTFILDLPSRGDTCFPSAVRRAAHDFLVYNYSSPIDAGGEDPTWMKGQIGPTLIYRQRLQLP